MKEEMRKYFPHRFPPDEEKKPTKEFSRYVDLFFRSSMDRNRLKCEHAVKALFEESMELKLLAGAMKKYGCNFSLERHIACEPCQNCSGGYDTDTNQIVVCQNGIISKSRIMATIAHEMIHMFDFCRAKFDFNNLEHVACSEIRAANLTYCSLADRFHFDCPVKFGIRGTQQYCVKDVAFRSVKAYSPESDPEEIANIVNKVFPACYNDLEPFGRRLTNGEFSVRQAYRERYYYGYA